jgi:hypothetical protein
MAEELYKLVKDNKTLATGSLNAMERLMKQYEEKDRIMEKYEEDQYDIIRITKPERLKEIALNMGMDERLVNSIPIHFDPEYSMEEPPKGLWGAFLSLTGLCKKGTLGRYCPLRNRIDLAENVDVDVIAGTYIHELVHAMQCETMGKFAYFLALTFARKNLEEDAQLLEDQYYDRLRS